MIFEDSKDLKNAGNPGNPFFKGNRRQPLLQCNGGMGMIRNDSSKMFQKLWGSFSHSYLSHPFASGHQVMGKSFRPRNWILLDHLPRHTYKIHIQKYMMRYTIYIIIINIIDTPYISEIIWMFFLVLRQGLQTPTSPTVDHCLRRRPSGRTRNPGCPTTGDAASGEFGDGLFLGSPR